MLTEEFPTVPDYPPDDQPSRRWTKRLLVGAALLLPLLLIGGFVAAAFGLSGAKIDHDSSALAKVETEAFGGEIESVEATDPHGKEIPIAVQGGKLVPEKKLHPGEKVHLEVVVKRPAVVGWVAGETETLDKMVSRVACDHQYIREWTFWLDVKILLKTFGAVMAQTNAC